MSKTGTCMACGRNNTKIKQCTNKKCKLWVCSKCGVKCGFTAWCCPKCSSKLREFG